MFVSIILNTKKVCVAITRFFSVLVGRLSFMSLYWYRPFSFNFLHTCFDTTTIYNAHAEYVLFSFHAIDPFFLFTTWYSWQVTVSSSITINDLCVFYLNISCLEVLLSNVFIQFSLCLCPHSTDISYYCWALNQSGRLIPFYD